MYKCVQMCIIFNYNTAVGCRASKGLSLSSSRASGGYMPTARPTRSFCSRFHHTRSFPFLRFFLLPSSQHLIERLPL